MSMHIQLRQGERIFINGSVFVAESPTQLDVDNDTAFLLDREILQVEETTTPLRQLYFVIQTMVIDPASKGEAKTIMDGMLKSMFDAYTTKAIVDGLRSVDALVSRDRATSALATIRELMPLEDEILGFVPDKVVLLQEAV